MTSILRIRSTGSVWLLALFAVVHAGSAGASEPKKSRYRADAVLRGYYWEGYATALREEIVHLAYGGASIVNRGTPSSPREHAWFAGYRDAIRENSAVIEKVYARQTKVSPRKREHE